MKNLIKEYEDLLKQTNDKLIELSKYEDGFLYIIFTNSFHTTYIDIFKNDYVAKLEKDSYNGDNGVSILYTNNSNVGVAHIFLSGEVVDAVLKSDKKRKTIRKIFEDFRVR
jgi:hypothetical protein